MPLAPEFEEYDRQQPSYGTTNPVDLTILDQPSDFHSAQ